MRNERNAYVQTAKNAFSHLLKGFLAVSLPVSSCGLCLAVGLPVSNLAVQLGLRMTAGHLRFAQPGLGSIQLRLQASCLAHVQLVGLHRRRERRLQNRRMCSLLQRQATVDMHAGCNFRT